MSRRALASCLVNGGLAVLAVVTLAPLAWMVSASLMATGESNTYPPPLWPAHPSFGHYRELFARLQLGRYLANSALLATAVTLCSLLFNSMAGYAFAKLRFAGRDRLFGALVAALVIPAQVAMLPLFLMLKSAGLINTYWGVIVPSAAGVFGIFLVRQHALSIPDELLDSARVDGAGELRIWWTIAIPLLRPVLVTLGVFTFMGTWNDFMWPLIVLTDESRYTLPVALASLSGEHTHDTELMMAGSVLTVLPVLALFLGLQRHYIEGLTLGSVKE